MSSDPNSITSYIGRPYKGTNPAGLDCWELVREVYQHCYGVTIPLTYDIAGDAVLQVSRALLRQARNGELWEPLQTPQAPSVILLANHPDHPQLVNHCGIYIGNGCFLHARKATGSVIERISSPVWSPKIRGYYRWKGTPAP